MWIGCLAASWVRAGALFYLSIRRETNIVRRYGIRTQATLDHCPVKTYLHFSAIPFPIKSVRAHLFDTSSKIFFSPLPSGNEQRRGKAFPPPPNTYSLPFFGTITIFRPRRGRRRGTLRCGGGLREKFLRADYRCQTSSVPLFLYSA